MVLSIAGSDSGGGAGIQADLRTFGALGTFGTTAITCVTAQNPVRVKGIHPVPAGWVALQIETVAEAFRIRAAKTGMLFSASIIRAVAAAVGRRRIPWLVVDPVMVATSGARLLRPDAMRALRERLLPLASVITPNLPEAEVLVGRSIPDLDAMRDAARSIAGALGVAVVVKGGHLGDVDRQGAEVVDLLCHGGRIFEFRTSRVCGVSTHGTGCTFSAALTAHLAHGMPLPRAVRRAQRYVHAALVHAAEVDRFRLLGTGR